MLSDCRQNLTHPNPASKSTHKIRAIICYFMALILDSLCPAPCFVRTRVIWDQVLDCSSQMFWIIRLRKAVSCRFLCYVLSINQNIKDPAGNFKCRNISLGWPTTPTSKLTDKIEKISNGNCRHAGQQILQWQKHAWPASCLKGISMTCLVAQAEDGYG